MGLACYRAVFAEGVLAFMDMYTVLKASADFLINQGGKPLDENNSEHFLHHFGFISGTPSAL